MLSERAVPPAPREPHKPRLEGQKAAGKRIHSSLGKKSFLRNEKLTKAALLLQSSRGNGANYKTCLGFSRQLLGNMSI